MWIQNSQMWIGLCFFDVFEPLDSKNAFFLGKNVDPEFPNVDPEFPNVDRTVFFRCF